MSISIETSRSLFYENVDRNTDNVMLIDIFGKIIKDKKIQIINLNYHFSEK